MIISGKYYPSAPQTDTAQQSQQNQQANDVDSVAALKTFFREDPDPDDYTDTVEISPNAIAAYRQYTPGATQVSTAPIATDDDPFVSYLKQKARDEYLFYGEDGAHRQLSDEDIQSALDEISQYFDAYNSREVSDVYDQIKQQNQQMSDEFILNASRYGVQNLL